MKVSITFVLSLVLNVLCLNIVHSLNILGFFPFQGKSHFFVFRPYLEELAKRGHNVTVVSYFPQKQPIKNYQDISLAGKATVIEDTIPIKRSYLQIITLTYYLMTIGTENCRIMLEDENVQNLWKSKAKFDLVLVELFNTDCPLGLAYKLGAPVVGISSHLLLPWHYKRFGVPYNPSYVPCLFLEGGTKPTLYQRIERTLFDFYFNTLFKLFSQRVDQNTLAQYFDDIPPLEDLSREISIQLSYQHFVLTGSRLFPGNIKEVGGYHVAKPRQLPDDLKKYIEESEHGVIYISFGSMLRAASTPIDKLEAIIGAVSELPQRVVWKWEEKTLPGNPKNIYLSNWLPQNDILAHPNVLAFYSHCGLLSTTEAIHHGVPMVAMPIFGDQPSNAAAVEESGLGVQIQAIELTKEKLLEKFKNVLDPEFRRNVKYISNAWHDRPVSSMDSAIYWTEFAARHRNLTLRTAAADVSLYQYLCLDIISIMVGVILTIVLIPYSLFSLIYLKNKSEKSKSSKYQQEIRRRKSKKE